jgi:uncharacterized membrane protein (UPF0127 family)
MGVKEIASNKRIIGIAFGLVILGFFLVLIYGYLNSNVKHEIGQLWRFFGGTNEEQLVIAKWYAPLHSMTVGNNSIRVSIADTPDTRMKGLSDTPYLPEGIGKLFIFEDSRPWGFWMKDMNYAIDIIWINSDREVVHMEEMVLPATYPKIFTPNTSAQYVLEVASGYASELGIKVGDVVVLPAPK